MSALSLTLSAKRAIRSSPDGDVIHIPLGNDLCALADAADAELLGQHTWSVSTHGRQYACTWLVRDGVPRRRIGMHRLLMGDPPGFQIDHANINGLDNRRANLRVCTQSQNNSNRLTPIGRSGYRGVSKNNNLWEARIGVNKKAHSLGTYRTPVEAALVYDEAARFHFGEFARLNFPAAGERGARESSAA